VKTSHRCWAEVDLDALRGNLAWIRHRVGPQVKILTVVKADAYGHGLKQIAALLMQSGTDIFGVANLAEAQAIRSVGRGWPVLMLGACLPDEVETAVRDEVRPTLSSLAEAKLFSAAAGRMRKTVTVHAKVDTGMGRLGVLADRAIELVEAVRKLPGLELEGLYTHFASAEDDARFSREQGKRFESVLAKLKDAGIRVPLLHANNSAGLLHEPGSIFNLVRPGLLVYGILPEGKRSDTSILRKFFAPALAFKCRVSLVKDIAKESSLSYGRTFIAPRRMKVAAITAGYGDGYLRAGSNRAEVLIDGRRCRVLGRITMDQMLVDVSRVRGVAPGDEVVLIGSQGKDSVTAAEVAGWCGTIPWEVLTNITYRVPRIYRGSQAA
jgi:alanine racemase